MTIHLIKLCVGISSIDHLRERQALRLNAGETLKHVTRMTPRRGDELLDGGSLYWVIKGAVQARQAIVGMEPVTGADGIKRCALLFDHELVATRIQPRRAFQGWRYFNPDDAPADLPRGAGFDDMPPDLRAELAELGLI